MTRRLLVLGALYVAQGLPFGFFTQALPVRMRESGMSLGAIGVASLLAAPWALKALWAPLVDRFGSRRAWIVPLQLAAAATLGALSFVEPERAWPFVLAAVLVSNALAAAQDVATDALAIDLLAPHERGPGNAVQVAGYRVGMILGGGVLLAVLADVGWAGALRALAMGTLVTTLPLLTLPEPPRTPLASIGWRAVVEAVRRPGAVRWLVVLVAYKGGDAIASAMLRPMLVDRGFDLARIGVLLGELGFGAGLAGALLGGWLVRPLGRARALLGFGVLQALAVGAYVVAARHAMFVPYAIAIEHLAGGMATAALFTCMMDACRPGLAATDYTLQASFVVIATGAGASVSGLIAEALGYERTFAISALLSLGAVALVESLRRRGAFPLSTMEALA